MSWSGEKQRHAMSSRGIQSTIRKHKREQFKQYKREVYLNDRNEILKAKKYKHAEVVTSMYTINKLYHHFKNNKEKYGIKEVKTGVTPLYIVGGTVFHIVWDNGNITSVFADIGPVGLIAEKFTYDM